MNFRLRIAGRRTAVPVARGWLCAWGRNRKHLSQRSRRRQNARTELFRTISQSSLLSPP